MANILVTEFTESMGRIAPRVYATPAEAAKDIALHKAGYAYIDEVNKSRPVGEKMGKTNIELNATSAAPGRYHDAINLDKAKLPHETFKQVKESLAAIESAVGRTAKTSVEEVSHYAGRLGTAGKFVAGAAAGSLALAGGANASEIASDSINAAVPGVGSLTKLVIGEGSKRGALCEAFGQATGAAAGLGAGLGVGAVTSLTGPAAVALGIGAGAVTDGVVTPVAEKGCNWAAAKLGF